MTTLYKMDAKGATRIWEIEANRSGYETSAGQLGGTINSKQHTIHQGKAGRNKEEQIELEMNSRIKKKIDGGYGYDIESANVKATNSLGLKKPMLAHSATRICLPDAFYLQYKYDGNRCIITKQEGEVIAYSRGGKRIDTIDHILSACKDIPEGVFLDGELYKHGVPLQTLRSWISRKQPRSESLEYILYDMIAPEPFIARMQEFKGYSLQNPVLIAPTVFLDGESAKSSIKARLDSAIVRGYEGLIARVGDDGYEDGKRSKSLIKIKRWMDAEFPIVAISASVDGLAILHCTTATDKEFRVTAPGANDMKANIYQNKENHIGRKVTVQFANWTSDGVPFHPVAIDFR